MPGSSTGPGRAQRKGRSAGGRTTIRPGTVRSGDRVGRYRSAEESGRYTPPAPRSAHKSPAWFGFALLALLGLGILTILLNYLSVLPGSVSGWYLVVGLVMIFAGFVMATKYR